MPGNANKPEQLLKNRFNPGKFFTNLTAGLISGVITITMGTAFSALIFAGPLSDFMSRGVSLILFGAFIMGVFTAITSSYKGTVVHPQEIPAVILALIASFIASAMQGKGTGEAVFVTVVAVIILTSLATGLFFLILGFLKAGNLIRFIPYPVIGGFLAGTGLLLVKGAFSVMTGKTLAIANLLYLAQPDILIKWFPGLFLAIILFLILRWRKHYLVMPLWLCASFGLFYLIMVTAHIPLSEVRAQGWLIEAFQKIEFRYPLSLSSFSQINWPLILTQIGNIGTIPIICCVSMLLNASSLELVVREEIDLNRELRSVGAADFMAGLFGGTAGFHSLSLSTLRYSMGANNRMVGLFSAAMCGSIIFFGSSLLSYFPRPIMGSVLLYLGFAFLYQWLYEAWFKLPRLDCFLIILILVVIGALGFIEGVGAGILIAIIIFVVRYSHVNVIKHALSGINYHSNVDRAPHQQQVLDEKGEEIYILKLQGFIFFGTANNLFEDIRKRANDRIMMPLRSVILDFRLVNGVDSSAVNSFSKMRQHAEVHSYVLVFTQISAELFNQFKRGGFDFMDDESFHMFPDLDLGMEWCENEILCSIDSVCIEKKQNLEDQLQDFLLSSVRIDHFLHYLERQEVPEGYYLIKQGDPPHSLYYLESGQVTVTLRNEYGQTVRLRTMGPGTVVGELGLYLSLPSTASVVTIKQSVFFKLTVEALRSMEEKEPELAAAFHRFIIHRMGERLAYTNQLLQVLMD
ncbi:MAG: SulP family inorganic anion transporter [Proteobacteria bacterium]|nr:SulP family inorganic anion transporter [Pseudomonadota bacterium]